MPCLYNLPEQERFCQYCSAACAERPAVKVITTTTTADPSIEENQIPMDTKDQLIEEVRKMRQLQKEYFRTRSHETLVASKSSESRVDKLLEELGTITLYEDEDTISW